MLENLLDKIIWGLFCIALLAIFYFTSIFVYQKVLGFGTPEVVVEEVTEPDYVDIDIVYDDEDEDYYEDEELDAIILPGAYEDAIGDAVDGTYSDEEWDNAETVDLPAPVRPPEQNNATPPRGNAATAPRNTPRASTQTDTRRYMVVAGSFSTEKNAKKYTDLLRQKGVPSEVVNFDNSRMYTVIASRYDNRAAADAYARKLKAMWIDCYVHTRRID